MNIFFSFHFRNVDEYVVGSRKKLLMSVFVKNQGEDSYETVFNMRMPYDVHYIRINKSAAHVSNIFLFVSQYNYQKSFDVIIF